MPFVKIQGMWDLHTSVVMRMKLTKIINLLLALKKIIGNYNAVFIHAELNLHLNKNKARDTLKNQDTQELLSNSE